MSHAQMFKLCLFFIAKPRARAGPVPGDPLLFDDTSSGGAPLNNQNYYDSGYNMEGGQAVGGVNNLFADPMTNAAMMYGSSLANQGKDIVNKEVSGESLIQSY